MKLSLIHYTSQMPELEGVEVEFHNRLHVHCLAVAVGTATLAAIIGFELSSQKAGLKRQGKREWRKWMAEHCQFSRFTAARYMHAAHLAWQRIKGKWSTQCSIPGKPRAWELNEVPDLRPSTMTKAELEKLERLIFEAVGGQTLAGLLHSSEEPQNLAEMMTCDAATATLLTGVKKADANSEPKATAKIGKISDFRKAWDSALPATRTQVLAVIDDVPLACELRKRNYLVTKIDPAEPTKTKPKK